MPKNTSFEFVSLQPEGPLADVVEALWFAHGTVPYRQEHIAPTGSSVGIFVFGDAIEQTPLGKGASPVRSRIGLFVGPHDGPIINRPHGETLAVGIIARPTGTGRLFNLLPAAYRGAVSQLDAVWPASTDFYCSLMEADTGTEKLALLQHQLTLSLGPELRGEAICRKAINILETDPKTAISDLADRIGMSVSNLDRTFTRLVGLPPRALSNLMKMRELLARLDVRQDNDWAGIAVEYGWYDQSHFVKAFKCYTGHTPTGYVRAQRNHFDDEMLANAAGFVPQS